MMTPSNSPLGGFLDRLEQFETRHRELSFDDLRRRLDDDPSSAWRLLVEKYSKFVYSLALQLARGTEDPEEIASEVFRRVFVRLESSDFALLRRFEGKCDFRTYLYRIVRTERFRLFRRRGVERDAQEVLVREADPVFRPSVPESPWSVGVGREAARDALRQLTEEDREILTLRFAAGLKLRELADVLGARDTNDAAYRVRRALSRCQALARARTSTDWSEEAFQEAVAEFRRDLFGASQNPEVRVSDSGDDAQGGSP